MKPSLIIQCFLKITEQFQMLCKLKFGRILLKMEVPHWYALGPNAGKHKINGVYASVGCLLLEHRSKFKNIFLLQLYHANDFHDFSKATISKKILILLEKYNFENKRQLRNHYPGANFGRLPELDHRATVGPTLATEVCWP